MNTLNPTIIIKAWHRHTLHPCRPHCARCKHRCVFIRCLSNHTHTAALWVGYETYWTIVSSHSSPPKNTRLITFCSMRCTKVLAGTAILLMLIPHAYALNRRQHWGVVGILSIPGNRHLRDAQRRTWLSDKKGRWRQTPSNELCTTMMRTHARSMPNPQACTLMHTNVSCVYTCNP